MESFVNGSPKEEFSVQFKKPINVAFLLVVPQCLTIEGSRQNPQTIFRQLSRPTQGFEPSIEAKCLTRDGQRNVREFVKVPADYERFRAARMPMASARTSAGASEMSF